MAKITDLPQETLVDIVSHVDRKVLTILALVSRQFLAPATVELYRSITFITSDKQRARLLLDVLRKREGLRPFIQHFSIDGRVPEGYYSRWSISLINYLAKNAESLRHLSLSGHRRFDTRHDSHLTLPRLSPKFPMACSTKLSLDQNTGWDDSRLELRGLASLQYVPQLSDLSMMNTSGFEPQHFQQLFRWVPNLSSLRLGYVEIRNVWYLRPQYVPTGLAQVLLTSGERLTRLEIVVTTEPPGIFDERVEDYCLACRLSPLGSVKGIKYLGLPLDWLMCNYNAELTTDPHNLHHPSVFSKPRSNLFPSSLETLQLQIPKDWLVERPVSPPFDDTTGVLHPYCYDRRDLPIAFIFELVLPKGSSLPSLRRVEIWQEDTSLDSTEFERLLRTYLTSINRTIAELDVEVVFVKDCTPYYTA